MQLIIKSELLKNIINWLFYLFPLSIILGNLAVNLNIILFVIFSLIFVIKNKIKLEFNKSIFIFFIFSCVLILSSIVNEQNLMKSVSYLRFTIFFYLGYLLSKEIINLQRVFQIFSIILFILCIDLIIQHVFNYNLLGQKNSTNGATSFFFDERVAGSFVQNFGFFLVFIIFSLLKEKNFLNNILKGFLVSLISIALLVTYQRMPMVIWIFFLSLYGIIYFKSKMLSILISFLFLTLFIFNNDWAKEKTFNSYGAFVSNVKTLISQSYNTYKINIDKNKLMKLKSNKEEVLEFMDNSGHGNLYGNALAVWKNDKLLGIGYKNFYSKCIKMQFIKCSTHPHNYYLDVLLSTGLVGFFLLLLFLINIFMKIIFNFKQSFLNKLEIEIIFVINFLMFFFPLKSSGSFFTTSNSTYLIIILILLISQLNRKTKIKI